MNQQTKDIKKTGTGAARKLRALFDEWARRDAETSYRDEPSWKEVKITINEGRPADGKPFFEE